MIVPYVRVCVCMHVSVGYRFPAVAQPTSSFYSTEFQILRSWFLPPTSSFTNFCVWEAQNTRGAKFPAFAWLILAADFQLLRGWRLALPTLALPMSAKCVVWNKTDLTDTHGGFYSCHSSSITEWGARKDLVLYISNFISHLEMVAIGLNFIYSYRSKAGEPKEVKKEMKVKLSSSHDKIQTWSASTAN